MVGFALELQDTLYTSSNHTRRWLHCSRREWVTNTLRKLGATGVGDALEVGPGSGIYLPVLSEIAERVTALDIEEAFLGRARELAQHNPKMTVRVGSINELPWQERSFDLVLCSEVVEHIPNSAKAIETIANLLRPGGYLVITTPHRWSILETVGRIALSSVMLPVTKFIYKEPVQNPGHVNLLTRKQLSQQIQSAGLSVLEWNSLGLYLPGVAEIGGKFGLSLERALEPAFRRFGLEQLLWTQCCICRRM